MRSRRSDGSPLERQQLDQVGSALGTFWHRARSALVADRIERVQAEEVVDVGAGAGHLGGWLRENAPHVHYRFQEPLPSLSASLSAQFGPENEVSEDDDLVSADMITVLDVIEHVEDDVGLLEELRRRARPGAALLVTVPAMPALHSSWDDALGHYRRYRRDDLGDRLSAAGFDVQECSYLFPELALPALLRRLRPGAREAAEFPELPVAVDRVAYALLRSTSRTSVQWPAGSSLLAVARRP
jgi:SAM-dependent methyltransferase